MIEAIKSLIFSLIIDYLYVLEVHLQLHHHVQCIECHQLLTHLIGLSIYHRLLHSIHFLQLIYIVHDVLNILHYQHVSICLYIQYILYYQILYIQYNHCLFLHYRQYGSIHYHNHSRKFHLHSNNPQLHRRIVCTLPRLGYRIDHQQFFFSLC